MRVYEVLTFKTHNIARMSHAPLPFLNKRDAMFHKDLAVAARPRGHRFFLERRNIMLILGSWAILFFYCIRWGNMRLAMFCCFQPSVDIFKKPWCTIPMQKLSILKLKVMVVFTSPEVGVRSSSSTVYFRTTPCWKTCVTTKVSLVLNKKENGNWGLYLIPLDFILFGKDSRIFVQNTALQTQIWNGYI
jgi:hypothetical protein